MAKVTCFRSLRWTPESRFLIGAEEIDHVHIFDRAKGFRESQVFTMLGSISGISLSSDGDTLFSAVSDPIFGCITQLDRKHFSLADLVI